MGLRCLFTLLPSDSASFGVIHIPLQDRPVFLTRDYGKLKKNVVHVRRGSSTGEADPDEIARMGLSKQLARVEDAQDFERRQKTLAVQPYFVGSGGQYNADRGQFKLKNKGEAIRNLSFEWPGEVEGTVRRTIYLDKEQEIVIDIERMPNPLPEKFPVVIHYDDKFGNRNSILLNYYFGEHQWVPEDPTIGG